MENNENYNQTPNIEPMTENAAEQESAATQDAYQYQQNSYGPTYNSETSWTTQNEETNQNQGTNQNQNTTGNGQYYNYQPPRRPKPPKKKSNRRALRIVLGGIGFGIIAALFFVGAVRVMNAVFPEKSIQTVDTTKPSLGVQPASGAAFVSQVSDVSGIVDKVMPSIVSITQSYKKSGYSLFGQYYEDNATGSGSGFIVSQDNNELLIVTNNHVVEGAEKIHVTFIDDTQVEATVKGTDSVADLAVLTINMNKLKDDTKSKIKVASLGDSNAAKVGQMAIAIGNALGYGQSVTVGYISAKDREVSITDESTKKVNKMTLLQTDAAINPGNSGGALLDINGNVIGINSVKYASSEVEGMGYAIPMSKAIPIINELMKREVLNEDEKGYLGITGRNITEDVSKNYGMPTGVYVVEVSGSGSAKAAGIKVGDIITKINNVDVKSIEQVKERVNSYRIGTELKITVKRSTDGEYKEKELTCKLKGSGTLNELETAQDETAGQNQQEDYFDGNGNSGSQALPWGGSLY